MSAKNHNEFILTPLGKIMKDVVASSSGLGFGIEAHPVFDYMMQSVFLKMTGAQEQKMKCICWELATQDYEYRRDRFVDNQLGACSIYKEKQIIYKDLVGQIKKIERKNFNFKRISGKEILKNVTDQIMSTFDGSNLEVWGQKLYLDFKYLWKTVTFNDFLTQDTVLFNENGQHYSLKKMYTNHLYKHRNRIAHNTLSYQQNLPTLNTLVDSNYKYNNYFIYFAILILIDEIFIELYKIYLLSLEEF